VILFTRQDTRAECLTPEELALLDTRLIAEQDGLTPRPSLFVVSGNR
jgi:hypothetical protein